MKKTPLQSAFFNPRVLVAFTLCLIGALLALVGLGVFTGSSAQAQGKDSKASNEKQPSGVVSGTSFKNDVSPPLRNQPPWPVTANGFEREANANPMIPNHHVDAPDPVIQNAHASMLARFAPSIPLPIRNFDGIPFPGVVCNCSPPDTNGAVGATQYVQMVNEALQVFDKATGTSVLGPVSINSIWSGFTAPCTAGSGDPVVIYDHFANRWLISQFAGSPPTDECIAISTTNDATGSWARYGFHISANFMDYPHGGIWRDAYYFGFNVFNSAGTAYLGPQAVAFDKAAMIAGAPAAFVAMPIQSPAVGFMMPADIDGATLPAVGAPETFMTFPSGGSYGVYHFHVDFVTPANSTYTLFASPPAAGFTQLCAGTRSCVPNLSGAGAMDGLGDRLMFRLAYRIIGGVERVVGNHSVNALGNAGIRWFEVRDVTAGPVTVFQESTYSPDATWRWMGSIAMDGSGDMMLGFSASSSTINPQIRYAGRFASDPINTLNQGEGHIIDGAGSPTGTGNRWGDYSAMTVDPVDDATFWYTQEYFSTTGTQFNWRTRIASFKFSFGVTTTNPACGSVVAVSPSDFVVNLSDPVTPGTVQATDFTVNGIPANSFVLSNLNATITFHFNSSPVTTQGVQTMNIPAGAFNRASDNQANVDFTCTFRYDVLLLQVTTTVPPVGGTFSPAAPNNYQYDVNWNEPVDPASVSTSDLTVTGNSGPSVTAVSVINSNMTTRFTLHMNFGGALTASIAAGAITDTFGNPNAAFSGNYTVQGCPPPNNYTIAQIGGSIVPGTVDTGNHGDDVTTTITLPFSFGLYDQTFTQVTLDSNGKAHFPGGASVFTNACLPQTGATYSVYPYWDDLRTDAALSGCSAFPGGTCGIYTSVSGVAPNRIFNIEWRAVYFSNNAQTANHELRLYEGQSRFDVIYGTVALGNTGATAGVQKDGTAFDQYFCNGSGSAATGGQSYTLIPCAQAPVPVSTVSRKTHGVAGNFDIDLPLVAIGGAVGIEDRTGAVAGAHQMWLPLPARSRWGVWR